MPPVARLVLLGLLLLVSVATPAAAPPEAEEGAAVPEHNEDEVREAKEEFDTIDVNHDGFISREEILEMEEVPEKEEIEEFFSTYDANGDGRVTFDEIMKADEELRQDGDAQSEEQPGEL